MFRVIVAAAKFATSSVGAHSVLSRNVARPSLVSQVVSRNFSSILQQNICAKFSLCKIAPVIDVPTRNVTKVSWKKGKRKSVKTVLKRFYRLNWGIWIRTIAGRHKRLWRKSGSRRRRLQYHVFCNASQSYMLDKMVGPYWRKPRYYIDDPYEPYHTREEFTLTATKPRPYFPPEEGK